MTRTATTTGFRYEMPRQKYSGLQNGSGFFLFCVLPCAAATAVPISFLKYAPDARQEVVVWCFTAVWTLMCLGFCGLFGAAGLIAATRGGRAWIWVSPRGIQAVQFYGLALRTAWVPAETFLRLTITHRTDLPGTSATLVAVLNNDAKRIADDYSTHQLTELAAVLAADFAAMRDIAAARL